MIYAQIKNNVVQNTIVIEDLSLSHLFSDEFDAFIRIDEMSPRPGISWSYSNGVFTAPPQPEDDTP